MINTMPIEKSGISPFELSDIDELSELEKRCFSIPWSAESLKMLSSAPCFGLIYRVDGKAVAYVGVMCVGEEAQLLNLATLPEYRGRGYAKALLLALFERVSKRGCSCCVLEVRESNASALGLYSNVGFFEVGRRKDYYQSPHEAAIIMEKKL